jgi:hypothetical protein
MSNLLSELSKAQAVGSHGIVQWGINQTSLEDVFMNVISEQEADPVVDTDYEIGGQASVYDGKWV